MTASRDGDLFRTIQARPKDRRSCVDRLLMVRQTARPGGSNLL